MGDNQVVAGHIVFNPANASLIVNGAQNRSEAIEFRQNADQLFFVIDNTHTGNFVINNDLHGLQDVVLFPNFHGIGLHIVAKVN